MTAPNNTSQAVNWYAARTCYGQEINVRDRLAAAGVEYFIPTETRRNSRGKNKEHPIIHCLIFIRTTKQEACDLKSLDFLPVKYLFDYVRHTMLTVPDKQMDDFRRVLEASVTEGGLVDQPLALGDRIRVTRGPLRGVEGHVLELSGKLYVVVGICGMAYAKARIPRAWLERIPGSDPA